MRKLLLRKNRHLFFDDHDLLAICRKLRGPTYIYFLDCLAERARAFQEATRLRDIFFAMKSNHHPEVLRCLASLGWGVDVVSGGELDLALSLGFSPKKIIYSGVGKTREDLIQALRAGIYQINIESFHELQLLETLAQDSVSPLRVALRINPNIKVRTHPYISTSEYSTKFGFSDEEWKKALRFFQKKRNIRLVGLSFHVGSLIKDMKSFQQAADFVLKKESQCRSLGLSLESLDVGGGLGIEYTQDADSDARLLRAYARALEALRKQAPHLQLLAEPGRFISARAGILLTPVTLIKDHFIVTESGMHHLLRPALYGSYHRIELVENRGRGVRLWDVVGPVCESADFLGKKRRLRIPKVGDWVAVLDVGAYGEVMMSDYNLFKRPQSLALKKKTRATSALASGPCNLKRP